MAGKHLAGDGLPANLAGMSSNELYDIMSQMKTLVEQNQQQARQILVQNPALAKALFQAQIMLGMVQSSQTPPTTSATASRNSQPSAMPNQHSNIQGRGQIGHNQIKKEEPDQTMPSYSQSQTIHPPKTQPHFIKQEPNAYLGDQSTPISIPQHTSSQAPSHQQPHMPPQQRQQMPVFAHQVHTQMGPNLGFQQPQMQHSQHMFHSGTKPSAGMGPSFPQGQMPLPNQPLHPSLYQAGNPHLGMEFSQARSSNQSDRGSNWISGPPENPTGQLPGPPSFAGQMGPGNQPSPPQPMNPELENALLQQVMSLTPEQINMLPTEQRNQVLQLQQMLRR